MRRERGDRCRRRELFEAPSRASVCACVERPRVERIILQVHRVDMPSLLLNALLRPRSRPPANRLACSRDLSRDYRVTFLLSSIVNRVA